MFKFTKIDLVNDFLALDDVDCLLDDLFNADNESYFAGFVLFEQEQQHLEKSNLIEGNVVFFKDLDMFEMAHYVKLGVEKYGL